MLPMEKQSLPHPVADGVPLSPNSTDSLICGSNTTYKLLLRQDRSPGWALPTSGWRRLEQGLPVQADGLKTKPV